MMHSSTVPSSHLTFKNAVPLLVNFILLPYHTRLLMAITFFRLHTRAFVNNNQVVPKLRFHWPNNLSKLRLGIKDYFVEFSCESGGHATIAVSGQQIESHANYAIVCGTIQS